jgi:hypothetical protein
MQVSQSSTDVIRPDCLRIYPFHCVTSLQNHAVTTSGRFMSNNKMNDKIKCSSLHETMNTE